MKAQKCPAVRLFKTVQFIKGSKALYFNTKHDKALKELQFLGPRFKYTLPPTMTGPRGLNTAKWTKLWETIKDFVPDEYKPEWENMPRSDKSEDLVKRFGLDEIEDHEE